MGNAKTLTFYLEPEMASRASDGKVKIVNRVVQAFQSCGYQCLFQENSDIALLQSADDPGYSMFHMDEPFHGRALTMRKAYFNPFWRIETSSKRSQWGTAIAGFNARDIDAKAASTFLRYWQNRLFGEAAVTDGGYIFVPLQGRLLERRSFQSMSPVEMLKSVLKAEPDRVIHATLHPNETYTADETGAIDALIGEHPRLILSSQGADNLIRGCRYVATQTSGVALTGYFFRKPAVLFGKTDFHHIAANVCDEGAASALSRVAQMRPPVAKYLFWFFQTKLINAARQDAGKKILDRVRALGWQV